MDSIDITNMPGLYELMWERIERFCGYETSSVRTEQAREVLCATEYVLRAGLKAQTCAIGGDSAISTHALGAKECFSIGIEALNTRMKRAKNMLAFARETAPSASNTALEHTLGAGLDAFFSRYDVYFGAHDTPGDIDYPLCIEIEASVTGLDYIEEYLRRLTYENMWLQSHYESRLSALLDRRFASPRELIYNIFSVALEDEIMRLLRREAPLDMEERGAEYSRAQLDTAAAVVSEPLTGSAAKYVYRAAIDAGAYAALKAMRH